MLRDYVKATRAFQKALALGEAAQRKLERQPTPGGAQGDDEAARVLAELERLRLAVSDHLVETHVELGRIYLARGSTTVAYDHAGRAAAIDPDDSGVAALRLAIAAGSQPVRSR
jgi:predicted TPR repeat methyltransferase